MTAKIDSRWQKALQLIQQNVTGQIYDTWFKPIVFEHFDEAQRMILVQVPSPFVYEYLEENFVDLLTKVLYECFGPKICLIVSSWIVSARTRAARRPFGRSLPMV